ncbi:MAG: SsrA-binding protein SmpB [Candidatus Kapabacteria bacterium]|nr:SsrA-binding protein SmpB [Candidatus Kapabacteria bacterium]MDW8225111.1 SsrA-binding protein SmpB [Bacteroidota bacterium]
MAGTPQRRKQRPIAVNRKARHEYEIIETLEAGIVLTGTEVKALREGRCNVEDAYAVFLDPHSHELWLLNLHIGPYSHAAPHANHEPKRPRKLLLHKRQAIRLRSKVQEKGLTLIPLSLYFSGPYVKVEIALARGKKLYDRREDIRRRDMEREMRRSLKQLP